jgi:S1-C subfamily serine protease
MSGMIPQRTPWLIFSLVAPICLGGWGAGATETSARIEHESNSIQVFKKVAPATVFVTQKKIVRDMWSLTAMEVPSGSGSGFIWDQAGHIVTNFHVIAKGRSFSVSLYNKKSFPAKLVGGDPRKDIAVLRIDAPKDILTAIRLPPESSKLEVGQKALAIGNPFGLDHTLTVGIVSALGREVKGFGGVTIRDMIQTDASINPGNSGGPLLNSAGELIGINTMIYSKSGASAGIGFAVPASTIRRVVPQIIRYKKPQRAIMGVELVSDEIAARHQIQGVVIEKVHRGTPAAKAGLRGLQRTRHGTYIGDIIVGIGKYRIKNYDDLYNALDRHNPGDLITVKVERNEKLIEFSLRLISSI